MVLASIDTDGSTGANFNIHNVTLNHSYAGASGVTLRGVTLAKFSGNTFNATGTTAVSITADGSGNKVGQLAWDASNTVQGGTLSFDWKNITSASGTLESSNSPYNLVVPAAIGTLYIQRNSVTQVFWVAAGITSTSWVSLTQSNLSPAYAALTVANTSGNTLLTVQDSTMQNGDSINYNTSGGLATLRYRTSGFTSGTVKWSQMLFDSAAYAAGVGTGECFGGNINADAKPTQACFGVINATKYDSISGSALGVLNFYSYGSAGLTKAGYFDQNQVLHLTHPYTLPSGTTAPTQPTSDDSDAVASDEFVHGVVDAAMGLTPPTGCPTGTVQYPCVVYDSGLVSQNSTNLYSVIYTAPSGAAGAYLIRGTLYATTASSTSFVVELAVKVTMSGQVSSTDAYNLMSATIGPSPGPPTQYTLFNEIPLEAGAVVRLANVPVSGSNSGGVWNYRITILRIQ